MRFTLIELLVAIVILLNGVAGILPIVSSDEKKEQKQQSAPSTTTDEIQSDWK